MFLYVILIFVHVVASLALIVSVLMQSSKGGGLAGTFGGSGVGGGVFGGRGAAPFLTKATTICAVTFMLTSISLNLVKIGGEESRLGRALQQSAPAQSVPAITDQMPVESGDSQTESAGETTTNDAE